MIEIKVLNVIRQIREDFGLPEELEHSLATYDTLAAPRRTGTAAQREQEAIASAAEQIIAAARDGKPIPDVGGQIDKATAADQTVEAAQKAMRQALEQAGNELRNSAAVNADAIVIECMRPKVLAAVEVIRKNANTIPMGMDDATAFRAPKTVQDAWRAASDAIDTIQRAIQLREQMARVGLDDIMPGTLEHLLIPTESFGDVEFYPQTSMIDRLLTYAKIGNDVCVRDDFGNRCGTAEAGCGAGSPRNSLFRVVVAWLACSRGKQPSRYPSLGLA